MVGRPKSTHPLLGYPDLLDVIRKYRKAKRHWPAKQGLMYFLKQTLGLDRGTRTLDRWLKAFDKSWEQALEDARHPPPFNETAAREIGRAFGARPSEVDAVLRAARAQTHIQRRAAQLDEFDDAQPGQPGVP